MAEFSNLSSDLTELILSLLPIPSLLRSAAVCHHWRSLIRSPSFLLRRRHPPWFFLHGLHNTNSKNNQSFAFDPLSDLWFRLPPPPPDPHPGSSVLGSDGFFFTTAPLFSFSPIFRPSWITTSPLRFSRINPLLAVFRSGSKPVRRRFILVGGVRLIGGLLDIEDRLSVEIYHPDADLWELCSPLPPDLRSGNSSHSLSSAFFQGKLYVLGIYSSFISSFDLRRSVWSEVQTLRPPGVVFAYLVSCSDRLVLAGICNSPSGPSFVVWRIEIETMEFIQISTMPADLLRGLIDGEEEDGTASLKCVGLGDSMYVFSEEYHRKYPACVCEMGRENGESGWRKVPPLPFAVNKFHKIISFCSAVSLQTILGREDEDDDDEHCSSSI